MNQRLWCTGLSGATISLVMKGISPIEPFIQAFRSFQFRAMQFGEASGVLYCTDNDIFHAFEANMKGKHPPNAIYQGGIVQLDTNARELSMWFSNCWGATVDESHRLLTSCLPTFMAISSWKIESDGVGPDQRLEGLDLDSLLIYLKLI